MVFIKVLIVSSNTGFFSSHSHIVIQCHPISASFFWLIPISYILNLITAGKEGFEIKEIYEEAPSNIRSSFAGLIAFCHYGLSKAFWCNMQRKAEVGFSVNFKEDENEYLSRVVKWINEYAENSGVDLVDIVSLKHSFNKTRPYKHGGKII